ncbi:hypothetical protein D9758_006494 [Tetrapyrgos nigripes]|uniref:F-box domain-containing protein n=1 Tax=Tetrapyrgos nigripes TaxID=182062 RepID=A0A8H5LRG2_9AGAR|nr:hypothetical protein D9758_006494 [Tetrapyrgos nigripes]
MTCCSLLDGKNSTRTLTTTVTVRRQFVLKLSSAPSYPPSVSSPYSGRNDSTSPFCQLQVHSDLTFLSHIKEVTLALFSIITSLPSELETRPEAVPNASAASPVDEEHTPKPHPLFELPELLRIIIENLGREDQVRCALMNQSWSEVALDVIWVEIDDLRLLLNALSPLKKKSQKKYEFNPQPNTKSWSRFETKYCSRVRILRHNGSNNYEISSLLNVVLRIRPLRPLLPNLQVIQWNGTEKGFDDILIFMHEGVRKCTIIDDNLQSGIRLDDLCEAIRSRMPFLTLLKIDMYPYAKYLEPLINLIKSLPHLKSLSLPAFEQTSKILPCILDLVNLKSMKFDASLVDSKNSEETIAVSDLGSYMDSWGESASFDFPSELAEIVFHCISLNAVLGFFRFRSLGNLMHLRDIYLFSTVTETPNAVRDLCKALSQTCRRMTHFKLSYDQGISNKLIEDQVNDSPDLPVLMSKDVVSFEDMQDILVCSEMIEFGLRHPYGLEITDDDIERVALAWPNLEYVQLGSYPARRVGKNFAKPSIKGYFLFVDHCPRIEEIHLCIDATIPFTPSKSYTPSPILRNLGVGLSELVDEYAFTMHISLICGPKCSLQYDPEDRFEKLKELGMKEKWAAAVKLLPLINGLKARVSATVGEKEERIRYLERELSLAKEMLENLQYGHSNDTRI